MAKRRQSDWDREPWDRTPYREIEMKIGEGLRERYKPPQELPHKLLTLLMQVTRESEGGDRSGYA